MYAIFNLLVNTIMTGFAFIGIGTFIVKTGNFFKVIENSKEDSFKEGFDAIMLESINDMNTCVESISIITNNVNKIIFILFDVFLGNKIVKKDKDGKIIICTKSKIHSHYKNKIEELHNKVKKYQNELNKIKKSDAVDKDNNDKNDSDDSSIEFSDVSSDEVSDNEEDKDKESDEFYLEN